MKKIRQGKQNKRNGANFFKYLQPPSPQPPTNPKMHSRSLIELEPNSSRYQQSARLPSGRDAHHSSLTNAAEPLETDTAKSNSLKKFLSIFGGPANLNHNSCVRTSARCEQKPTQKTSGRQVFTCNIKNMNVNLTTSKQKQIRESSTMLVLKRDKIQNTNAQHFQSQPPRHQQLEAVLELKRALEDGKEREASLRRQLQQSQKDNNTLKKQIQNSSLQRHTLQKQWAEREDHLVKRTEQLQKALAAKEKCREHELIIQSLKKVINQQLRKIIELQKSKIEREEIEKLEERINKNINMANQSSVKEKLRLIEGQNDTKMRRKDRRSIKIQDESFESAQSSPNRQLQTYQDTIEQATEQEERGSQSKMSEGQADTILDQVDKYLAQWRSKS